MNSQVFLTFLSGIIWHVLFVFKRTTLHHGNSKRSNWHAHWWNISVRRTWKHTDKEIQHDRLSVVVVFKAQDTACRAWRFILVPWFHTRIPWLDHLSYFKVHSRSLNINLSFHILQIESHERFFLSNFAEAVKLNFA